MFAGHFAAGFALKKVAPSVSLGTLFFAAQFVDLLWPVLLLAGIEHAEITGDGTHPPIRFTEYPYSHSLLMTAVWALAIGGAHFARKRKLAAAVVCGGAVVSHWVLDLLVHHPDLPLAPGHTARVGLGLWESIPLSLGLELALLMGGLFLYSRATVAADRRGRFGLWALAVFLALMQLGNALGSPPPNIAAVAWVGHAQWLLVLWGWWVDRHRTPRTPGPVVA